jgi:hypothetical protein
LTDDLAALVQKPPFRPGHASDARQFTSSVLDNLAAQMDEKAGPLSPTSLSAPIGQRRSQLVAPGGPVEHLQIRAQVLTLQTYVLLGGSTAISYLSVLAEYLDAPSAVGAGLLGWLLGAYRLQGGWKKAKGRFAQNYDRVQSGLQYDLQVRLEPSAG